MISPSHSIIKKGPIVHAVCEFYKCGLEPVLAPRDHMMDDCVHAIDTVRWMCGGEVADVEAHCKRIGVPDINWIGGMLHFDNGSTGFVINSWASGRRVFRVQMHAPGIYCDAEVEGKAYFSTPTATTTESNMTRRKRLEATSSTSTAASGRKTANSSIR